MSGIFYVLAAAVQTTNVAAPDTQKAEYFRFCFDGQTSSATVEQCKELAAIAREAELHVIKLEQASQGALIACRKKIEESAAKTPLEMFENAIEAVEGGNAIPEPSTTSSADNACKKNASYIAANTKAENARKQFFKLLQRLSDQQSRLLAKPHSPTDKSAKEGDRPVFAYERCGLEQENVDFLGFPNECVRAAIAKSNPTVSYPGGPRLGGPSRTKLLPSLATTASGGEAKLTLKGESRSYREAFTRDGEFTSRQPATFTYSLSLSVKEQDGIGGIVSARPDNGSDKDKGFFSLDRLSSSLSPSFSIGSNYYPRETWDSFNKRREKVYRDLRSACEKSLAAETTAAITNCRDESLLTWLFERGVAGYARIAQIEEYEKLVWRSPAAYPNKGYGLTGSFGLENQGYHLFSTADGKFDPALVDTLFFAETAKTKSVKYGKISNKLAYTIGGYGFYHWDFGQNRWMEGITARFDSTLKYNIQKLDELSVVICRDDISGIVENGVYLDSKRCKSTVRLRPEFNETGILAGQLRFGFRPYWIIPRMGLVPSVEYEDGPGVERTVRFAGRAYFGIGDGPLSAGFGVSHEIDENLTDNKAATAVFITLGTGFSLDGSKD